MQAQNEENLSVYWYISAPILRYLSPPLLSIFSNSPSHKMHSPMKRKREQSFCEQIPLKLDTPLVPSLPYLYIKFLIKLVKI